MPNVTIRSLEEVAVDPTCPVTYTEFATASRRPPQPPAFIFGPLPADLAPDLFSNFDVPAVGCYHLQGAQVTFDAIILLRGQPLWSLALNHPHYHVPDVLARNVPAFQALPVRRVSGRAAIIHGPGYNIFGHWLVDFLPRLYVLRRAGYDIGALKFILPRQLAGFARTILRLIAVPEENLVWHDQKAELLQPDELVAPTMLRLRDRFNPLLGTATRFWLSRLAGSANFPAEPESCRRIFISRSQHESNRGLVSRNAIEARAAAAGYEIVHPECLALPEQIRLFGSATRIIGEYGSGLHGTIYAPAGAAVCALRGTSHHPGFAQSGLAECFGHHLGYVFGETPRFAQDQEMTIDDETFDRALAAMEIWGTDAGRH